MGSADQPSPARRLAGVDQAFGDGAARPASELLSQLRERLARLDANHPSAWDDDRDRGRPEADRGAGVRGEASAVTDEFADEREQLGEVGGSRDGFSAGVGDRPSAGDQTAPGEPDSPGEMGPDRSSRADRPAGAAGDAGAGSAGEVGAGSSPHEPGDGSSDGGAATGEIGSPGSPGSPGWDATGGPAGDLGLIGRAETSAGGPGVTQAGGRAGEAYRPWFAAGEQGTPWFLDPSSES